jgi:hypothetical protein
MYLHILFVLENFKIMFLCILDMYHEALVNFFTKLYPGGIRSHDP